MISIALNTDFVFWINFVSKFNVFTLDSVPDALIRSSILRGLPAEYNADSIRCFFAVLFLARDEKIDILQEEGNEEIRITLIK